MKTLRALARDPRVRTAAAAIVGAIATLLLQLVDAAPAP